MTVVEYDGRDRRRRRGAALPDRRDGRASTSCCPTSPTCANAPRTSRAIVVTHGHEDHLGALPWVLRELGEATSRVYGGPLTIAMARSKLDEHKLKDVDSRTSTTGERSSSGRSTIELVHMTHSIPDSDAVALHHRAGDGARHRRLQVRPDAGRRPAGRRRRAWPSWAARELLLLCGDSTNADRAGLLAQRGGRRARTCEEVFARCEGRIVVTSFASNIHRVQQVVDAAAALGRKVSLVGRSMRKNVNIGRPLGHIEVPEGDARAAARDRGLPRRQARDHLDRAPRASRCPRCGGWPTATTRRSSCTTGDTVVFSATPIPGNERAVNETIDRLYHIGCDVITTRDAPIHASGHGYAEEVKLMLNLVAPALRDAVPRRLQAHPPARASSPRRWGSTPTRSSRARTGCRWRSTATARASARASSRG